MPKAVQLDFLDHLQDKVKEVNEINTPELREISQTIDQMYLARAVTRGYCKRVYVREHFRHVE